MPRTPPFRQPPALALLCCAAALAAGCDPSDTGLAGPSPAPVAFSQAPATGNGGKIVFPFNQDDKLSCGGGQVLDVHLGGWLQLRVFDQPRNRQISLVMLHAIFTYTNSDGERFVVRDVMVQRFYSKDGHLFIAFSGRRNGPGVIGHVVINVDTGEIELEAGRQFAGAEALACEALT